MKFLVNVFSRPLLEQNYTQWKTYHFQEIVILKQNEKIKANWLGKPGLNT